MCGKVILCYANPIKYLFELVDDTVGVVCLAMLVDGDRIPYQEIGLQKRRFYFESKLWMVDYLHGIGLNGLGSLDF
jgi:hypothetical protein